MAVGSPLRAALASVGSRWGRGDGVDRKARRTWPAPRALVVPGLALLVVALLVVYALVLGALRPNRSGNELRQDQLAQLTKSKLIASATFEDEDAVVVLRSTDGARFWSAYPKSDAVTADLFASLSKSAAQVRVDSQSGKATLRLVAAAGVVLVTAARRRRPGAARAHVGAPPTSF